MRHLPWPTYTSIQRVSWHYTSVPWNANQHNLWLRQLQRPTYTSIQRVSWCCGFAMQLITTLHSMEARRWQKYYTSVPWNANQPNLWLRQLPRATYTSIQRVSWCCGFAMQLITTLHSMEARRWRKYYTRVPWNANQPNLWVRQLQRPTYTSSQRVSWCCGFAMQLLLRGDGRTGRSGDGEGEETDG